MDLLQQARAEIDTVDAEMAALFERRMRAVADVVRYKAETGKPVFDAAREAAVLDKNTARITDEALRPYYRAFLSDAMSISRAYQRARLGRDTAAYQGVPGAWSHIALRRLFPFARETACTTWGEVFDAVQNRRRGPPCGRAERPERCGYCQCRDRRAVRPADLVRGHQRRRRQHNAVHRDRACRRPRHDRRGAAAGAAVHGTP